MTIEGSLRDDPIAEVLLRIGDEGRTGILTIQGEDDIVALSFLDGGVVAADALNRTVEDGLREILVERGEVGADEFVALASEHHAGGGRVIDLLVERDYVDRPTLLDALREQTERLVLAVMTWSAGDYKFYGGNEVFREDGFEPIAVEGALLRGAVELGAAGPFGGWTPDPEAVYERLPEVAESPPEGPLADARRRLVELVDGGSTAAELVASAGLAEARGMVALARLETAGVVRRRPAPGAERRAQRPPEWDLEEAEVEAATVGGEAGSDGALLALLERFAAALQAASRGVLPWGVRLFAVALIAGVVVVLARAPLVVLHPFPWERGALEEMRSSRQETRLFEIDRAARAYHLLEGRFPESLQALAATGLLPQADLVDSEGRPLTISSSELSYVVLAADPDAGEPGLTPRGSAQVIGDVLLDSAFLVDPGSGPLAPLVLLD